MKMTQQIFLNQRVAAATNNADMDSLPLVMESGFVLAFQQTLPCAAGFCCP